MSQTSYKFLLAVLAFALVGVGVVFGSTLLRTWREYGVLKQREAAYQQQIAEARITRAHQEVYLKKLIEDPEFLERVIRERMGYSRPNEIIFRFVDE